MDKKNIFIKNNLINNNSFSNLKNKDLLFISTPKRNLKLNYNKNYSLTAIEYGDINSKEKNIHLINY